MGCVASSNAAFSGSRIGLQGCRVGSQRLTQHGAAGAAEGTMARGVQRDVGSCTLCPPAAPSQGLMLTSLADEEEPDLQPDGSEAARAVLPHCTESGLLLLDSSSGDICTHAG